MNWHIFRPLFVSVPPRSRRPAQAKSMCVPDVSAIYTRCLLTFATSYGNEDHRLNQGVVPDDHLKGGAGAVPGASLVTACCQAVPVNPEQAKSAVERREARRPDKKGRRTLPKERSQFVRRPGALSPRMREGLKRNGKEGAARAPQSGKNRYTDQRSVGFAGLFDK